MLLSRLTDLYLRYFPVFFAKTDKLIELIQADHPNFALVVLFGSVARGEPRRYSDADVLFLCHDQQVFFGDSGAPRPGVEALRLAEESVGMYAYDWPFSGVTGDAPASDLDADFLS